MKDSHNPKTPPTPTPTPRDIYMSCPHTFLENNFGGTFKFEMIVEYEHQQFELDFDQTFVFFLEECLTINSTISIGTYRSIDN